MAEDKTSCPTNSIISEYWECEIATLKFRANVSAFDASERSDWYPAGCYCQYRNENECGDRGLNRNLVPRNQITADVKALCRMQGIMP